MNLYFNKGVWEGREWNSERVKEWKSEIVKEWHWSWSVIIIPCQFKFWRNVRNYTNHYIQVVQVDVDSLKIKNEHVFNNKWHFVRPIKTLLLNQNFKSFISRHLQVGYYCIYCTLYKKHKKHKNTKHTSSPLAIFFFSRHKIFIFFQPLLSFKLNNHCTTRIKSNRNRDRHIIPLPNLITISSNLPYPTLLKTQKTTI